MVRVRGAQISLLMSSLTTWLAVMWLVTVTVSPGAYCRTITPLANFPPGASCSCDQSELSTGQLSQSQLTLTGASHASPQIPHRPPMAALHW